MPTDAPATPGPLPTSPLVIAAQSAVLGEGMRISRALPSRPRRMVGAWCFLDHFGPADVSGGAGMRVGPHPHIGLQTVTWLVRGEVLHRDSLGSLQSIRPGQLNLMTAGRGISHSEESPAQRSPELHGAQLWIALPESRRGCEPDFQHLEQLPVLEHAGLRISVIVGEFLGARSDADVHTPLLGVECVATQPARGSLPLRPRFEHALMMLEGRALFGGRQLDPGQLLYLPPGADSLPVSTDGAARWLLLGGEPFTEPMRMWWNFVARTPDELRQACVDWNAQADYFGRVVGYDGERLAAPLPPW